jgi:hypothetical protein
MNRLPTVLRLEIWEYVYGNRSFWQTKFRQCMDELVQPRDISHSFEPVDDCEYMQRESKRCIEFLESFDPESKPIHQRTGYNSHLVELIQTRGPSVRFTHSAEFVDGRLTVGRFGDVLDSLLFTEHVPEEVVLCFGDVWSNHLMIEPIRLRPVGNRLKVSWIPLVGLAYIHVWFIVNGPQQNFSCELVMCDFDDPYRDFLSRTVCTTSFKIGNSSIKIKFMNGSVYKVRL